jgi:pimeloyl-[acyl-carrier protein] methyl ester esterase
VNKKIYSEVSGTGQDVILLHGWGMHGGLWGKFKIRLADHFRIHVIDLPGYGYSKNVSSETTLDTISETVESYIQEINKPVVLIGWSLGGLVTLNIVKRNNAAVVKAIFIATSPCFTKRTGWEKAMEQSVFDEFAENLSTDYRKTLQRFLTLQTRGSTIARDTLRELKNKLNERGEPDIGALKAGLKILSETDLRNSSKYELPAMVILGEKDTLVPVTVKNEFAKLFSNMECLVVNKTGHAPFLSNANTCEENIKNFINEE